MAESTFGDKVVGAEAAAKAIAAAKGGGEVFGKRVVDAIAEPSADSVAKKNSEFGARVANNAVNQDSKGKKGVPSVEDLENILEENPTTFDSLYENELAQAAGPRVEALRIFAIVENGIKGAGRPHVLAEINGLLGKNKVTAAQRADHFRAATTQIEEQQERMDDNAKLGDVERVRSLRQREEDLAFLAKSNNKSTRSQLHSSDVDSQVKAIAQRDGLTLTGDGKEQKSGSVKPEAKSELTARSSGEQGRGPHTDLAVDDVKPETSQDNPRSSQKKDGVEADKAETKKPATKRRKARRKAAKK